jgi:putative acetyltransferase
MIIRPEKPSEFPKINCLVKIAFKTAKVTDGKEQDLVKKLRQSGNYIPELALVAEENGKLIGHIMFTKTFIVGKDKKFETLLLAPVSVALEFRNQGTGSALIKKSLKLAKELGYSSVVLVGDPKYYHRFGFKSAVKFGIRHIHSIPDENVMIFELVPKAMNGISGTVDC